MTATQFAAPRRKPLRLWPGVVAAVLLCLIRYVSPLIFSEAGAIAIIGGILGALAIVVWWLFFSRAPWLERLGALVVMVVAPIVMLRIVHESIATGMMGMLLPLYSVPAMSVALVAWAVATQHFSSGLRRTSLVAAILLAWAWEPDQARTIGLAMTGLVFTVSGLVDAIGSKGKHIGWAPLTLIGLSSFAALLLG